MEDYRQGLAASGFEQVAVIDTGADLNAYALVANQSCCCSPSMVGHDSSRDAGCSTEGFHEELARLLTRFDVNDYAASVKVCAVKASTSSS